MIYLAISDTDRIMYHQNGWLLSGLRLSDARQHLSAACNRSVEANTCYRIRLQFIRGHTLDTRFEDHRRFAVVSTRKV